MEWHSSGSFMGLQQKQLQSSPGLVLAVNKLEARLRGPMLQPGKKDWIKIRHIPKSTVVTSDA
jgi:hypothetical protein